MAYENKDNKIKYDKVKHGNFKPSNLWQQAS